MKKSKFLQNPKDLLSRSFNPSKCKTSLRLAGSRLKLLRNKKEVQIKQMKKEIAQLLESGQDRTARIRVEHVVREEKVMAAYDLIEIYCELIVARLPIIDSQKNCPIDLKEAIASIIFASPRCGDVPELLDVKKHFTAKYGKNFLIAAIELRPASGVSSMLIEKLSAKAPDLQTKIKILSAIAEEHNIKWDANSLDEKDLVPPNDLLSGPSTFGREKDVHVEPSLVESPVFQPSSSNNKISLPLNVPQPDPRTSIGPEKLVHPHDEVFQPKASPTGLGDERSQLFKGNSNTVPPDRQSWHMGFKDATSAAQAAAESAERASMAARAAAELSNRDRLMRQHSTESYNAEDVYVSKDEGPEFYANSKPTSEQFSEVRVEKPSSENNKLRNEQTDETKTNDLKTASNFRNNNRGGRKEHRHSNSEAAGGYSWKGSLTKDSRSEMLMKKESFKNEVESADDIPEKSENIIEEFKNEVESEDNIPEKSENIIEERIVKQPGVKSSRSHSSVSDDVNIFANSKIYMDGQSFEKSESTIEERIGKQPSVNSSHSHSNVSDDVNIFSKAQEFEYDAGQDPFVSIHKGDTHGEASHESAFAYFDKCDSESDSHGFDIGPRYDEHESQYHSTEHLSFNTDSWGPRSSKPVKDTSSLFFTRKNSFPAFSENMTSVSGAEVDNSMPLTFDDSDGSTSENDDDNNMSKHIGITESKNSPRTHEKIGSPKESRYTEFEREHLSFSDNKFQFEKNEAKKSNADFQEFGKTSHLPEESSFDSGEGLNFQQLTGGFRDKGYNRPPYLKNRSDESSLLDTTSTIKSLDKSTSSQRKRGTRKLAVDLDSDSDSSEEDMSSQKKPGHKQEPYALSSRKDVNPKLSLRTSNSIFGSGNSDSDGDAPKESPSRKNNHRSGISRRTKLSPISSAQSSYSKTRIDAETLDSDAGMDTKPRTSQISEIPKESESKIRILTQQESYEQPTSSKPSSKPAKSNYWGPPEQFGNSKPTNSIFLGTSERVKSEKAQKSKISRKSSVVEESTRSESKTEKSTIHESPKAGKYSENSSSKDEGNKKASHVHPKLPDYDSLVQSLRMNRS